ncbi:MAG: hypothetical protein K2X72_21615 [Reyranella sp.]|nr:hypothetical protein [Reyranella sp.]
MNYSDYANPKGSYLDYAKPSRGQSPVRGGTLRPATASSTYEVTHVYYRKDQESPEVELLIPWHFGRRVLADRSYAFFSRYKTDVETGIERAMLEASKMLLDLAMSLAAPELSAMEKLAIKHLKDAYSSLDPHEDLAHGSREQSLRTLLGIYLGRSYLTTPYDPNPFVFPSDVMLSLRESAFAENATQAEVAARMALLFHLIDLRLYEWKVEVDVADAESLFKLESSLTDKTLFFDKTLETCLQVPLFFGPKAEPNYVGLRITQLTRHVDVEHAKKKYPQVPYSTSW